VGAFITRVQQHVDGIYNRLQDAQRAVNAIEQILAGWAQPLLRRAPEDRKLLNMAEEVRPP